MIAAVGSEPFGAYVISMATDASDVLAVRLLQKEAGIKDHLRVAPLFETKADLEHCPAVMDLLFKNSWYSANLSSPPQVSEASRNMLANPSVCRRELLHAVPRAHSIRLDRVPPSEAFWATR